MDASELKTYIIENNKIEEVLISLGCHKLKKNNGEIRCALPNHTNSTSVSVKLDTLSTTVYSDDLSSKGDIFTFIMDLKDVKFYDAMKYLHETLNLDMSAKKYIKTNKIDVLSIFKNARSLANAHFSKKVELELLEDFSGEYIFLPHIDWIKDGILPFACKRFNIGYDIKSKRILIPHRLWCGKENNFVGVVGRTTLQNSEMFDIPKYIAIKPYPKSLNVYGLQENYQSIQKAGYAVVYEAEKSVLKRYSVKDETGVAICGHSMSSEQAKILISLNVDIIIAMDRGITLKETREICEKFYGTRNVYYLYDTYDVILKDKESPADTDRVRFSALMQTKVLYDASEHYKYIKSKGDTE